MLTLPDPADARIPWLSTVHVLEETGPIPIAARELGRTSMIIAGWAGLPVGTAVTLEVELCGDRFQVLAHVEAVILSKGAALTELRLGATSPRGNDLIKATVEHTLSHPVPPVRSRLAA
jgi:hypothetical protein